MSKCCIYRTSHVSFGFQLYQSAGSSSSKIHTTKDESKKIQTIKDQTKNSKPRLMLSAMSDETERGRGRNAQRRAFWFLTEASWRFRHSVSVYSRLVDLMTMFERGEITKDGLRVQVAALFEGHQDLLDRFDRLPWDNLQTNHGAAAVAAAAAVATTAQRGKASEQRPKKKIK